MTLQDQADEIMRQQGDLDSERDLLESPVRKHGGPVASPGINTIHGVVLWSGTQAFHKPWQGVAQKNARAYGHEPHQIPINECAAWRLAAALEDPLDERVATCVLWSHEGLPGSLTARAPGVGRTSAPFDTARDQCLQAAFFDALIAQQDRHDDNFRWDGADDRLTLFDHGYAFAKPEAYAGESMFVTWRWAIGAEALDGWEKDALKRLTTDRDLLGAALFLLPERASALWSRASTMLRTGKILQRGEF